ncbi:MAG: S8 family serine peptidase [Flavobacteriia bacterium]|nr:S8 family serine peptidase [Flavobacteriia bacterium]
MRKKLLLFFTVAASLLFGQTADEIKKITANYDTATLQSLSEQFHAQYLADKEYALKKAAELNIPLVIEENGRRAELQKFLADGTPVYYTTFNLDAARSTRTNHLQIGGSLGLNLMGQNMTAHIWDEGVARITHQEYDGDGGNNRYSIGDGTTVLNFHSAHVAGTIMASGVEPQAKGMAPYGKAVGYDWNNDLSEAANAASNKGMLISSHSYGWGASSLPAWVFGAYVDDSRDWDNLMFNAKYYLMVVAAGNDGLFVNPQPVGGVSGYDKLSSHATSKNNLVIANAQDANVDSGGNLNSVFINSTSSQGPTDDYRIKPDLTGNGTGVYSTYQNTDTAYNSISGTSMATPNVSGTLLLLQEHYNKLNSVFMRAATLKGLVLHTADDAGPTGPDAIWGWGLMNAKRAAETISYKDTHSIIEEASISTGQTLTFTVDSDGLNPLIASISWTDRPGSVNNGTLNRTTPVLVNDLDIRVTKGGTTFYPWKLTGVTTNGKGDNNVDPFERVDIPGASGAYTITITYKGTLTGGSQDFSLIVTGINTSACSRAVSSAAADPVCSSGTSNITVTGNSGTTQLRLYAVSLGGTPIATINGNSGTFTTPNLTQTTTYYVAAADAGCESARYPVTIVVSDPPPAVNVVKADHSTPGNCDLDYSELTASGAKLSNIQIHQDDLSTSSWGVQASHNTRVYAGFFNSNNAGGVMPEIGIYRASNTNQNGTQTLLYPLIDGDIASFDVSSYTSLTFKFKHKFVFKAGTGLSRNIILGISTDGANFATAWSRTNIAANINAETVTVDLSAYIGSPTISFLFGYIGSSNGLDNWYIDDIEIIGDIQAPITWTPTTGLFTNQALTNPYTGGHALKVYASPATTQNYTASAAYSPGACAATKSVEVNPDLSDYLANTGNWSVASNWSNNTVPDITKCVRVPNGKTLTVNVDNAQAKRLKVDAGGKIFIGKDKALTVDGSIQNDATADDFVIESGGSLVQNDDSAVNTGQITAKRNFIFSPQRKQYNYIISPVIGQPIKQIYTNPPYVIYHKEEFNFFYNAYNGDYIAGRGLAIKEPPVASIPASTIDAVMKGEPFNGILNYPLSYTTTQPGVDHGFNLVGNPYPSNLDLMQLYQDNSSKITADFMFWDNRGNALFEQMGSGYGGSSYAVFNASGPGTGTAAPSSSALSDKKIPNRYTRPATAFLIRALPGANGQTLDFKNQYRVAANSPGSPEYFGKGVAPEPADRYWLTLTTPSEVDFMSAVVYFDGGDDAYTADDSDALNLSDELYTLTADHQLLIQGRKSFDNLDKVNLGYRAFETGTYIISIFDKEGVFAEGQNIWLIDLLLDRVVNLTEKPYKFMTRPGEYNDRFVIVYRPTKTKSIDANVGNEILFAKKDNKIVVTLTIDKISEIEIFNLVGKSVFKNSEINSNEFKINSLNFNHQVIVVAVITETGELVTRKFINN